MSQRTRAETGHVPFKEICLERIQPHWLNDEIYGPVDPDDPDLLALAQSIRDYGLKEELVLTSDLYVLSGHRRRVAAKLAGLKKVLCQVEDFDSHDPRIPALLATYNRQRIKTADAILREEVVLSNPEEAYQDLLSHRVSQARLRCDEELEFITLEEKRKRSRISAAKTPFLNAVIGILREYWDYRPLTDRQIHYYLLNNPPLIHAGKPNSRYANNQRSYKRLTDLLTCARLEGRIPFHCIHDPTRPVETWNFPASIAPFIRDQVNDFLKGYFRNLMQSQPNHIEIVGEKNTISGILEPIAAEYCIPMTTGRGYSSLPPRHAMSERFRKSGKYKLILLVVSDFDPEGDDIPQSFAHSMRDDFGIESVVPIKVALTYEQTQTMELATDELTPPKTSSSRYKKFARRYGSDVNVYELEAIPPDQLQNMLRRAIESVIDKDAFLAEVEQEKRDAAYLDGVRKIVKKTLGEIPELRSE
jgi:hypothetical protein